MNLLTELKRRNVFRVGIFYAALSWLILQVADVLFGVTRLPDWSLTLVAIILGLGFLPAVIFAWVFELTPEGLKRERDIDRSRSVTHQTARKLDIAVIVLIVFALGVFAAERYFGGLGPRSAPDAAASGGSAEADRAPDLAAGPSIAVLAFANMSPDPDNAFFAEGISEEILNVLAQVEGLTVASRTSAFSFAGKDTPIPEIARRLGVAHVLEGSVRKAGNRVRITAQLVDAERDAHLWSEAYDHELTDIFAVQEEIAQAITRALKGALGVASVQVGAPTGDLEAYQLYLRGRNLFHRRGSSLDEAAADLRTAVERDSTFADAWAYLAAVCSVVPGYPSEMDLARSRSCAEEAVDRALALRSDHPLALGVKGRLLAEAGDQIAALATGSRASGLKWQGETPRFWHATDLFTAGYVDEALALLQQVQRADPLVGIYNGWLGAAYLATGRYGLAEPLFDFAAENGWTNGLLESAVYLGSVGEQARAQTMISRALRSGVSGAIRVDPESVTPLAEALLDRRPGAHRVLLELEARMLSKGLLSAPLDARFFILAQDVEEVFARPWANNFFRLLWHPETLVYREDPRAFEIFRERGFVELWEQRGYPDGCVLADSAPAHLECSPGDQPREPSSRSTASG